MKTALAIICSLVLAWTNIVLAQTLEASPAGTVHSCCHCGNTRSCCAAHHSNPGLPPVSTAPVSFQNQFAPLAPAAIAWILPGTVAHDFSSSSFPLAKAVGAALFARNCSWLI
jgi:hypothetical protein